MQWENNTKFAQKVDIIQIQIVKLKDYVFFFFRETQEREDSQGPKENRYVIRRKHGLMY